MKLDDLLREKREEVLRLIARYGASNVRVFGSVARGDFGPESDIDLLILPGPGMSLFKHAALERELADLLGCRVNLVSERGLRPRVRERVMQEAVTL
ncbi:MAG: nucleotidyltransferase family protein [Candidatus Tectomicrobia bacterium]|uniref:Nucleotidyltransferase family protein n=1 Tax=Tectimicrobiota bacterium TaxID=2528274 RepID=A0A932I1P9_UNCTE|nr:nucleotidyltransferase family protein [Candidatus Tectomicrobia bacterium]